MTTTFSGEATSVPAKVVQQFVPFHLGVVPAFTGSGVSSTRSASGVCTSSDGTGSALPSSSSAWARSSSALAIMKPCVQQVEALRYRTGKVECFRHYHFAWRLRKVERNAIPEHRSIIIRRLRISGRSACATGLPGTAGLKNQFSQGMLD